MRPDRKLSSMRGTPNMQMTNEAVMAALRSDSVLNRARSVFSGKSAELEQQSQQRRPLGPIEMRGMEFEAVAKIASVLGVEVDLTADPTKAVRTVVHQVEVWRPPEMAGSGPSVEFKTVQPSRDAALEHVRSAPPGPDRDCRCWAIYGVVVGDPDGTPMDRVFLTQDGRTFAQPDEAWDADEPLTAPAPR